MALISVVIPVYNEEACLPELFDRLDKLQEQAKEDAYEFVFVDDGSTDDSRRIILQQASRRPNVKYVFLSRNFGHEVASTAGLDHVSGDAAVILDADLQDPPELIPSMIARWRQGNQVVHARRKRREGEGFLKKSTSWAFYRIIRRLADVDIPADTGDFRLMDRQVVESFRRCRERNRFVRGLISWAGFRQTAVEYSRSERFAGKTKYRFLKLAILALDAVTSFSDVPLRIGVFLGLVVCLVSVTMAAVVTSQKLFWNMPMPGYAMLATGIFFLGGVQLLVLGMIGEYVGRTYRQVQGRPLYIVEEKSPDLPPGHEGWHQDCPSPDDVAGPPRKGQG